MKLKIELKNRWTGKVLFEFETEDNTILKTIVEANLRGANLREANLTEANLTGANLGGADLGGANLRGADLGGADLGGADLGGANLRGANLREANLGEANLTGANLRGANLREADLRGADLGEADLGEANLTGANLRGANLRESDLRGADLGEADLLPIKNDMFIVLLHGIKEIDFLRQNIIDGKIDGSTYDGKCACLSGTLMNGVFAQNGEDQSKFGKLIMNCRDSGRPIERFFLGISIGDIPKTNQFSKLALDWIDEFKALISA